MNTLRNPLLYGTLALIFVIAGCKKDNNDTPSTPANNPGATASLADRQKDSAVAISRDIYLWYNQIPASFNGRSYPNLNAIMEAIRQYSTEPGFTGPVDKWSFAVKQSEWNNVASGISGDFGLGVLFRAADDLRVRSVEKNSPAAAAGIRRGWRITAINGNSNINTNNQELVINGVFNAANTNFTFLKPDGSTQNIALTATNFQENPVLLDTTYNIGSRKIGYLVFNSFLGDTIKIVNDFQRIFNNYTANNINDLIVDLRYNGGGYVNLQQQLANYIAPPAANGQMMMQYRFNDKHSRQNVPLFFNKKGSINLPRVVFLVSRFTASASELLINNLKPFMEVVLVGPSRTVGKPVGYFPLEVGDEYIFPISFRTVNNRGEGSYFGGFQLNNQVADGLDKDWGDPAESTLASALRYLTTGAFRTAQQPAFQPLSAQVEQGNNSLTRDEFSGMVAPSHTIKR